MFELTGAHFDRRDHAKLAKRLVRRLQDLGLRSPSPRPPSGKVSC
jgi:hypothetical protein